MNMRIKKRIQTTLEEELESGISNSRVRLSKGNGKFSSGLKIS